MPATVESVLNLAMTLSEQDRARVADQLIESVASSTDDLTDDVKGTLDRRWDEIVSGKVNCRDAFEVLAEVEQNTMFDLRTHPEAEQELDDAVRHLAERTLWQATRFADAYHSALVRIRTEPAHAHFVWREFRRYNIPGFSHSLIYRHHARKAPSRLLETSDRRRPSVRQFVILFGELEI